MFTFKTGPVPVYSATQNSFSNFELEEICSIDTKPHIPSLPRSPFHTPLSKIRIKFSAAMVIMYANSVEL